MLVPPQFRIIVFLARLFLATVCILFFLWIFDQNIPFAGIKNITYTFSAMQGGVSELYPRARVLKPSRETEKAVHTIIEDPVYFDIRTRVAYEKAHIAVWYKNQSSRSVSLGMRIPEKEPKNVLAKEVVRSQDGEWEVVSAEFELGNTPLVDNKYTFLISIPGLQYDTRGQESVTVLKSVITLSRKPLFL